MSSPVLARPPTRPLLALVDQAQGGDDPGAHVTAGQCDALLRGVLAGEQACALEAHIDVCDECRMLLSALARSERVIHTTDISKPALPLRPGETVGGKYRVERIIGSGGMGTVVAAWHLQLNQRVALKFMLRVLSADRAAVDRFQREARAAARLVSPHVGRVLDMDLLPDGTPFLVMEYLEGQSLADRLEKDRLIPAEVATDWIRQALGGLAEAHRLGITHRDFKPGNLFLAQEADGREVVKVLDFGIAKSAHPDIEEGLTATSSRQMVGSPPYMAPEQVSHHAKVDARTDVWAVGVVLYQMLSGVLPFRGDNLVELWVNIQKEPHGPLGELVPKAPVGLCRLVDWCLAKDPGERPADAGALLEALDSVAAGNRLSSTLPTRRPRSRGGWILAGVGVAMWILALGFYVAVRTARSPPQPEPLPPVPEVRVQSVPPPLPAPPAPQVKPVAHPAPLARRPARAKPARTTERVTPSDDDLLDVRR